MHTHFHSASKGMVEIEAAHSAHLLNAIAKMRREGNADPSLIAHMEAVAHRKEREWHDTDPEGFAAWVEKATPEKVAEFRKRHGLEG